MRTTLVALLLAVCVMMTLAFEQPPDMSDAEYIKILRQFAGDDVDPKLSVKQLKKLIKKKYGDGVQMGFSGAQNGEPIRVGFGDEF